MKDTERPSPSGSGSGPSDESANPLAEAVAEWLQAQGYPLEYRTAHACRRAGFSTDQGRYVEREAEMPSEVDVLASLMRIVEHDGLRLLARSYTVIECKFAQTPWVVFTASSGRLASTIIAQSLASELAQASLYFSAGNRDLGALSLFAAPRHPGFGGRQALTKNDTFYKAVQSVVGASMSLVEKYNLYREDDGFPTSAVTAHPVVVVDGKLFETGFDEEVGELTLRESSHVRLHWRGAKRSGVQTTVDIVTVSGLSDFLSARRSDTEMLLDVLARRAVQLRDYWNGLPFDKTTITPAPTGMSGMPAFLHEVHRKRRRG